MRAASSMMLLLAVSILVVCFPSSARGPEEIILDITVSGSLSMGVEVSWGLDAHSQIRTGLNLVVVLGVPPSPLFGLWGRVFYLYNPIPEERVSFYGGAGLSGILGFIRYWPPPPALEWAPLRIMLEGVGGVKYFPADRLCLLGEVRGGLSIAHDPLHLVVPLALTVGVGYSLR